jgi:hypothetical protein
MWRRPRARNRGHESPVPRPAEMPGCVEPSRRSRQAVSAMEAVPGRQRHGGAPRGGPPVAPEGPRLASVASRAYERDISKVGACRRSAIPSRGWQHDEGINPGRRKRRGSGESCGSKRIAVRTNRESGCRAHPGPGLFDIVNRGSTALPETSVPGTRVALVWWAKIARRVVAGGHSPRRRA